MTDPIANLIAAARTVCQAIDEGGGPTQRDMQSLRSAIYRAEFSSAETAKAAAEARPEPQLLGTTTTLREPRAGWAVVAMRVGANTLWRECPIADMAKDAAECAAVMMRRHGEARPEPAAEPNVVDNLIRQGHESLNAGAMIASVRSALMAVEALAREVRK